MIDYIFQCTLSQILGIDAAILKAIKCKQIPSVRVPRNRAAKNISLCFPSSLLPLGITPVPKFISNDMRTS